MVTKIYRLKKVKLSFLHCISSYPNEDQNSYLSNITFLQKKFNCAIGISDHTNGIKIPIYGAILGAQIIEKHFTLDRQLPGPDHMASLEPKELERMVQEIRAVGLALGDGRKVPAASEENTAAVARKSLVAARDIAAGEVLTGDLIAIRRPPP